MVPRDVIRGFYLFTMGAFFFTGMAKLLSIRSAARILTLTDPITGIPNRHLVLLTGIIETSIAFLVMTRAPERVKAIAVWVFSSMILAYRFTKSAFNVGDTCPCLGSLIATFHLSSKDVEGVLLSIAVVLFIGSSCILCNLSRIPDLAADSCSRESS